MKRPRTIPRVGSFLVLAALAVAAGIAEPGYCQDRPLPGWSSTGNLNAPRCGQTATLLASGKVLVVGGSSGHCSSIDSKTLDSAELYDPVTGAWSITGSLKQPRTYHTATLLLNGLVLVVGGQVASATSFDAIATAELYDPDAGDWKSTGSLIAQRSYHTATLLQNGNVLVAGGSSAAGSSHSSVDSAELYDPSTGTWSRTGNLITGRYWHTATQLRNGNVLVAGGLVDVAPNMGQIEGSAELYDPVGGAWTRTADLNEVHSQHTATRMQDGRVLVASGDSPYDSYDDPGTAEIYDPDTATWSNTGNLRVIRNGHTATLLPSGKVLVTGGVYFSAMNGAELYDPVSGTWAPTGDVITPRFFGHTATLLSDGNVLVAAGARETDNPAPLDSAELYDDGPVSAQVQTAVEYGTSCPACWDYGDYSEYFVTSFPDEIAALDGGAFGGEWHRTGETFKVWTGAASGALPTCRFFNATFIDHFYTPYAAECAWVQANPTWHWQYEGIAFYLQVPDGNGNCPTGTTILYRLFNNGMGGALVHRLTTSAATFNQMRAAGWVFEGDGRTFAFACVPQ